MCHPKTRKLLLQKISEWAKNPEAKTVFWLNGKAGTGKSTISRTLAHDFSENCRLGASFFFKRDEGDRGRSSKFFTTIAAQLVQRKPVLMRHIQKAVHDDPAILTSNKQKQFTKLILEPLLDIPSDLQTGDTLLIVIDALDECKGSKDIILIIQLLSRLIKCPKMRIFITSRPESPIREGFRKVNDTHQGLILDEIPEAEIKNDLSIYMRDELAIIREELKLDRSWATPLEIQSLVEMAVPLFIFAATVCRFLADHESANPKEKLRKVLNQQTRSHEGTTDAMYRLILDQMLIGLSGDDIDHVLGEFRIIIGSIVVLSSPLSAEALAQLIEIDRDIVDYRLRLLHSILRIPPSSSSPITLLHNSFRDFLLDSKRRKEDQTLFLVNKKEAHKHLVAQCLQVLNKTLRVDICEVRWPGTPRASVNPKTINKNLPPEAQYACQYWAYHLKEAENSLADDGPTHNFLTQHFLHWLEALSLLDQVLESTQNIKMLQSLLQVCRKSI